VFVCLRLNVTTERRRLALVGLCILAVALGAALFPTAGFGSVPGGGAGDGPSAGDGGGGGGSDDGPVAPTPTPTRTVTPTDRLGPTGDPVAYESPTPTPTPTEGDEVVADPPGDPPTGPLEWTAARLPLVLGVGAVVTICLYALFVLGGRASEFTSDAEGERGSESALELVFSPVRIVKCISQGTMVALVGFSTLTARALGVVGTATGAVATGVAALTSGRLPSGRGPVEALVRACRVPVTLLSAVSLSAIPGVLGAVTASGASGAPSSQTTDGRAAAPVDPTDDDPEHVADPTTVTDAWEVLTDAVSVDDHRSTTPTEYARAAVEQGFPARPVGRLARAFRRVRYGDERPTADQTAAAVDAARRIRSATADPDEESDAGGSDDGGREPPDGRENDGGSPGGDT